MKRLYDDLVISTLISLFRGILLKIIVEFCHEYLLRKPVELYSSSNAHVAVTTQNFHIGVVNTPGLSETDDVVEKTSTFLLIQK